MKLVYLYTGTEDVGRDVTFYREALGAELVWRFNAFEADVAAIRLGDGPLVLLADHRPAPSCLPIWAVDDLERYTDALRATGWEVDAQRVEVPDGPVLVLHDPSGNHIALLDQVRPNALDGAWHDPENEHAVREDDA